jgi:hypothetical protein
MAEPVFQRQWQSDVEDDAGRHENHGNRTDGQGSNSSLIDRRQLFKSSRVARSSWPEARLLLAARQ